VDKENIIKLMSMMGMKSTVQRGYWMSGTPCPFAKWFHEGGVDNRPSFGISIGESSGFHCFGCGRKGSNLQMLPTILSQLTHEDYKDVRHFISEHDSLEGYSKEKVSKFLDVISPTILDRYSEIDFELPYINRKSINEWGLMFDYVEYRLIFRIMDKYGRMVGIRGRFMGDNKDIAPYRTYSELNQSGDAKRSGVWYGMHFPLVPNKYLVLVEGERDAILLKQSGINNVWAAMGSSITDLQIETLKDINNPILLFFDRDKAGEKAYKEVIKNYGTSKSLYSIIEYYTTNLDIKWKDPAELVEKGLLNKVLKSISKI
jgi:DNA primase